MVNIVTSGRHRSAGELNLNATDGVYWFHATLNRPVCLDGVFTADSVVHTAELFWQRAVLIFPPAWAVAKYWWVCLCVCLSVHEDISGTTCEIFTKFLCVLLMSVAQSSSGILTIGRIAYRQEEGEGNAQRGRSVINDCLVFVLSVDLAIQYLACRCLMTFKFVKVFHMMDWALDTVGEKGVRYLRPGSDVVAMYWNLQW